VAAVLNAIYEEDFLGFSYGFRPGRSAHDALDALCVGIDRRKVNFILDADIRSFFDTVNQQWLIRFVEHRVGDRRIIRLIQKWLRAGVLEDGIVTDWNADFAGLPPVALPDCRTLETLAELRAYVLALPSREQAEPRWQAAVAVLLKAAEHGGPCRFIARVSFGRALHGIEGFEPAPAPRVTKAEPMKAKRGAAKR
jgi:hypothetical protein